jgi:hypothetical protein
MIKMLKQHEKTSTEKEDDEQNVSFLFKKLKEYQEFKKENDLSCKYDSLVKTFQNDVSEIHTADSNKMTNVLKALENQIETKTKALFASNGKDETRDENNNLNSRENLTFYFD